MNNDINNEMDDELRPEYDLTKLKGGVRGKYASKYKEKTNLAEVFKDDESINKMNDAFKSIRQGLEEAVAYAKGKKSGVRIHHRSVPDVKTIRKKTGMDQNEFAVTLGVTVKTLKGWEEGERKPRGPGLVLLNIIDKAPKTVMDILSQ